LVLNPLDRTIVHMQPLTRDKWVSEFLDELVELRPDLSSASKFTYTIALQEWAARHETDPREAARQWSSNPRGA